MSKKLTNMKYLKLFESQNNKVIVTVVDFTGGGDGVTAVYIDGYLEFYGDEYHDDISSKVDGFILGLEWIKKNYIYPLVVEREEYTVTDENLIEDVSANADYPPKNLSEFRH